MNSVLVDCPCKAAHQDLATNRNDGRTGDSGLCCLLCAALWFSENRGARRAPAELVAAYRVGGADAARTMMLQHPELDPTGLVR